jgi:hypothetical protein
VTEQEAPYLPIAIGFYLLALPMLVSVFLAEAPAGAWTNGIAALVFAALGLALQRKAR